MMFASLKIYALLGLVIVGVTLWAFYERKDAQVARRDKQLAEEHLAQAVAVNRANSKTLRELRLDVQFEREVTAHEMKKAADRLAASQKLIREMRDVPGYDAPAGAVWDEYARRLRQHDGDRAPSH